MSGVCTSHNESSNVIFIELEIRFGVQIWPSRKTPSLPRTFAPFLTRRSNCPSTAVNVKELYFEFPNYLSTPAISQVANFSFHRDITVINISTFKEFIGAWYSLKMTVEV
jgi:hypothetical protein